MKNNRRVLSALVAMIMTVAMCITGMYVPWNMAYAEDDILSSTETTTDELGINEGAENDITAPSEESQEEAHFSADVMEASEETITSDFNYSMTSNSTITITKYIGSENSVVVPSEIDGTPVTKIGSEAFSDCNKITDIVLPNSITSISASAFLNCSSIKKIDLPDSLKGIGSYAFKNCKKLVSIMMPANDMMIGANAFQNCTVFSTIYYEGCSVDDFNNHVSIEMPNSVFDKAELVYVHKASDWVSNGDATCAEDGTKTGLCDNCGESVTVKDYGSSLSHAEVIDAKEEATYEEDGLTEGKHCSVCNEVIIEQEKIPALCKQYFEYESTSQDTICISKYIGATSESTDGRVIVPSTIDGKPVTEIGASSFKGCEDITEIIIPSGVTTIGTSAFEGCSQLTDLEFPNSVSDIKSAALKDCISLENIAIPEGVTSIESTFDGCTGLNNVSLPESLTTIGYKSFYHCTGINSLKLPKNVESVGNSSFSGCSELANITLPDGVTNIGALAFYGCTNLSSIEIPDSVNSIEYEAFYGCSSLKSLEFPAKLTSIERYTCCGCSSLSDVMIPEGISSIEYNAFQDCSSLTSITIPNSVNNIGNAAFYGCVALTDVVIPSEVKSIGSSGFSRCSNLEKITLPEGLTSLGGNAFYKCEKLKSITIPEGVTTIGNATFSECSALANVVIPKSVTSIGYQAFYKCSSLLSVAIPDAVTSIGNEAFYGSGIEKVYYGCTRESFNNISIGEGNQEYNDADIEYMHETNSWKSNEDATCTKDGTKTAVCEVCGKSITIEDVGSACHEWNSEPTIDKPATCTEEGLQSIHCARCDETKDPEVIPATGHSYLHKKKAAGYCKDGSEYDECAVCHNVVNKKTLRGYSTYYVKGFKVSKGSKSFTAKWSKQSTKNQKKFTGYQIQYSKYSNMSYAKYATAKKSSKSKKITKLAKKKKYYVRVRTYRTVGGKTYYSKWSSKKTVTTK